MSDILEGLDGVICRMDDILIHGRNQIEHDVRVRAVLFRLQKAGLTLNIQKCEFSQGRLKFLGHIVDAQGVHADPEKTNAIGQFPTPKNVTELQRFMGMVNQLGKFVPGLADINAPLRQLLRKDSAWYWGEAQQTALQQVKEKLASPEVLAHYDPNRATYRCETYRSNQRKSFNQRHRAKELPAVTAGDSVWIRDQNRLGKIQGRTQHPRSFLIETEKGTIRRNRSALVKAELQSPSKADKQATSTGTANYHAFLETEEKTGPPQLPGTIAEAPMQPACSQTAPLPSQHPDTITEAPMQPVRSQTVPLQTRSGRIVKPPDRLDL